MAEPRTLNRWLVLACGAAILALAMGTRHSFGLFLQPISNAHGWGRDVFAFAIALQNLVWGVSQPLSGMIADRFGAGRVVVTGAVLYVIGLVAMAYAHTPLALALSAGLLVGLGLSGTTFSVILGVVGRVMPEASRSMAMGVCSAIASFGQFAFLPIAFSFIGSMGWASTLLAFSGIAALVVPLSAAMRERPNPGGPAFSATEAFREALGHRGFWLLCFGFFVCGFQILFIGTHIPAFLVDRGLPLSTGTTVLALIGLFNIGGTYIAGWWGGRARKPALLSGIYLARGVVIALFLLAPVTTASAYAFAVGMGLLWLSTVPLTNGTVASVFGVSSLSMLGGFVFLFHQVGAFLGGWLGGVLYDRRGSYDLVWMISIALSVFAALINLPIREEAVPRLRAAVNPA
ncbi:MAG TPA: MFS transporter [Myxococcaceae bacterium]|nr:MFS transporter [Myxococcaceae bacterium]